MSKGYEFLWVVILIVPAFFLGRYSGWECEMTISQDQPIAVEKVFSKNVPQTLKFLSIDELCKNSNPEPMPAELNFFRWREEYWSQSVLPYVHKRAQEQGKIKVLEIGVEAGSSTKWLLKNMIEPFPGSQYIGVDLLRDKVRSYLCDNLGQSPLSAEPMFVRDYTVPTLIEIAAQKYKQRDKNSARYGNPELFDFIYIDGGHSGTEVFSDLAFCWALLKKGGMMVMDDYDLLDQWTPTTPKLVFDPFLTVYQQFFEKQWIHQNQIYLIKSQDAIFGSILGKNYTI